ncbi:hypothetical protein K493DRAFT_339024 [Basidiobolus meristosporus CBS 931.73]|uniref:Myb-like domain-containing protein n=1 Tax=Basidiobolus meristosporus CBS 931.73 TaxID=1314790 RepID=A0A1Y1Y1X6_9FUNG|nr:hypothetical protein K493DRAFT_339024 [Basidiobolus meristosporus CBS 931.73]|eukprot:ORX92012.1 hypothetical protein K493DRAFT_339024 [Basidiobolus meristosporus CBS 931.73]
MDQATRPYKRPRIHQEPLENSSIFGSVWTGDEKEKFFRALQKYGKRDIRRIADDIKSKSYVEVGLYLDILERTAMEKENKGSDSEEDDEMNSVHPSAQDISTVSLRVEERQAKKLLEAEERKAIKRAEREYNTRLTEEESKKIEVLHIENALSLSSLSVLVPSTLPSLTITNMMLSTRLYMKEEPVILKGLFLEMYNCLLRFLVPLIRDVIIFAEEHVIDPVARPQNKMIHINDVRKALLSRNAEFNRDTFFFRLIERLSKEDRLVEDSDSDSDEPLIYASRRNTRQVVEVPPQYENDSTTDDDDDDDDNQEESECSSSSESICQDRFSDPEDTLIYLNDLQTDGESEQSTSSNGEDL